MSGATVAAPLRIVEMERPCGGQLRSDTGNRSRFFRTALFRQQTVFCPKKSLENQEGVNMSKVGFVRTVAAGLSVCWLIACGGAPQVDRAVDTRKIPITTISDEALDAFLKGRWLFDNLRLTDAHQYFLKAVEADPDFALAHLRAANTASTNQEFFDSFRLAVDRSVNASEGEKLLIGAFEAAVAGDPETQRSKLEALVALFPEDERSHNAIGIFFFGQQDYERAISAYRAAIDVNPDFAQPYNQLGYALRFVGDYAAAEEVFQRYTELIPDQPNPYDSYAELLLKMGRYEESIASYEKALAIDANFIASYVGIGNNQIFMGQFEDARSTFAGIEEIARNDGERRAARIWTAASYLHQDDFENAFDEAQKLYDIAAETDDRGAMSGDFNLMGDILLRAGRSDEAAEKYQAQIEMMQSSDATEEVKEAVVRNQKYDLARVALWKGDVERASELADAYRNEVEIHNARFEVQRTSELDAMIAIAEDDLEAAIGHLEQADQQDPQIWLLKARTYAALGDEEGARSACEHVINFNQLNFDLAYVRNTARELLETL
jgi:tetratricopeptide (TPR) repeat protein